MIHAIREKLTFLLLLLLPFHAVGVTVLTKLIAGRGQAPLVWVAAWKEGLLILILGCAMVEWRNWRLEAGSWRAIMKRGDVLDVCVIGLLLIAFVSSLSHLKPPFSSLFYGFKYDFLPLLAFVVLRRVPWSEAFMRSVLRGLLVVSGIVAVYGIVTLFLPSRFFTLLGYSDLHSLYFPGGPIAAFQHVGESGIRRVQATFSGPSQLGLWMLLPLSMMLTRLLSERRLFVYAFVRVFDALLFVTIGAVLVLTFSRAALIGAGVMVIAALYPFLPRRQFWNAAAALGALLATGLVLLSLLFPRVFLRSASTRDHFRRPLEAMETILQHPLGLGLGSAGPASNRVSDACVFLPMGADASWAEDHQDLCVFAGERQVQPVSRACRCPLLPENWYLQIGIEMGWAGLLLYLYLVGIVLRLLVSRFSISPFHGIATLSFLGISIAALFLHAWEDAAVAYTLWGMVAMALPVHEGREASEVALGNS